MPSAAGVYSCEHKETQEHLYRGFISLKLVAEMLLYVQDPFL